MKLIKEIYGCYVNKLLSRPRRFGKSLLDSMLDYYSKGEKELFRGLTIEQLERHPPSSPKPSRRPTTIWVYTK